MHESDLTAIALKLADGTPIDWERLKTEAPEAHARLLERFQQIEALAHLRVSSVSEREQLDSIRKGLSSDAGTPLRWGHLEILEKVGRGSYGDVYKARDARLDRIVALKLLKDRDAGAQSDSEIIDEARLLARVRHPNVVTVYGAERIDGRVGVWMEFIDGQTLEDAIQAKGPLPWRTIRDIAIALCGALTAVHGAGLLHRDIKAQNVMMDVHGRIVLADFGAGRDSQVSDVLDAEDIAGTPAYLAPEMWRGAPASPQTEVYGLGILLYRLATASFPVSGRTARDIKNAHDRMLRTTCHDAHTALPRSLVRIVDRAIDPDPIRRYQSAEALESALHAVSIAEGAMLLEINRRPSMFLGGWKIVLVVPTILLALVAWASSFLIEPPEPPRGGLVFTQPGDEGNSVIRELLDSARQMKELVAPNRLFMAVVGGAIGFSIGVALLSAFGHGSGRGRRRRSSAHRRRA